MIKLLKLFVFNKIAAALFIKITLKSHSISYKLAAKFSTILNDGVHPKHDIIKYTDWFVENLGCDEVIIDIGCNAGAMVEIMSSKSKFVYGIEIEPNLLRQAKQNCQKTNNEFICADATTYEYSQCKPIDIITLSNVLEHIKDRDAFLKKIIEKVPWKDRSSKKLLIRVPMLDREWITVYKKDIGVEYRLDNTHFTEYTFEQFLEEMRLAEIDVIDHHVVFGELYAVCRAFVKVN